MKRIDVMMTELKIIITDGPYVPFVNVAGQAVPITAHVAEAPSVRAYSVNQYGESAPAADAYTVSVTPVQVIYITREQLAKLLEELAKLK